MNAKSLVLALACQMISGIAIANTLELPALQSSYDAQIVDTDKQKPIGLQQLVKQLKQADVIFIGEYHGNNAAHLLQAQLQALLYQQRPQQILSMEQFTQAHQDTVNQYLTGKIGEQELIDDAEGWANYKASYRPLVEFAKQHQLPIIAANAPSDIVRCVGQKGQDYTEVLTPIQKQQIANQPFFYTQNYLDKFSGLMHVGREVSKKASTPSNSFYAQILRDNSMAQAIVNAQRRYPTHQIIHLNGTFHSESFLGTVDSLKHLNPALKIAVISPIQVKPLQPINVQSQDLNLGNYIYYINNLPTDYVQDSKRMQAMQKMFSTAKQKAENCLAIPTQP